MARHYFPLGILSLRQYLTRMAENGYAAMKQEGMGEDTAIWVSKRTQEPAKHDQFATWRSQRQPASGVGVGLGTPHLLVTPLMSCLGSIF